MELQEDILSDASSLEDEGVQSFRGKKKKVLASDSEDEEERCSDIVVGSHINKRETLNKQSINLDNYSEEERIESIYKQNELEKVESGNVHNSVIAESDNFSSSANDSRIYTTNEKGEVVLENGGDSAIYKSRLQTLCDSESSDDEGTGIHIAEENKSPSIYSKSNSGARKSYKKSKPNRKSDEVSAKKMTGKEAAEQRNEIRSESQRMLRESRLSLPYHKPKARTLKEFLQNRPRLASALPSNATHIPPSVAIKMSKQQLEIVSKKLKERKKEVKDFYKSESESEEETENKIVQKQTETMNDNEMLVNNENVNNLIQSEVLNEVDKHTVKLSEGENHHTQSHVLNNVAERRISNENNMETSKNGQNELGIEILIAASDNNGGSNVNSNTLLPSIAANDKENSDAENISFECDSNQQNNSVVIVVEEIEVHLTVENECNDNKTEKLDVAREQLPSGNSINNVENDSNQKDNNVKHVEVNVIVEPGCNDKTEKLDSEKSVNNSEINNCMNEPNVETVDKSSSFEYEFNLDDIDDDFSENQDVAAITTDTNTKTACADKHLDHLLQKFSAYPSVNTSTLDTDVNCKKGSETYTGKSRKELLKEKLLNHKPKLSGGPDQVIDLEDGVAKPSAVTMLIERFMKHVVPKNNLKQKVELDIMSLSQGEIRKETVTMNVDAEDEPVVVTEKPGAKLQKLRDELHQQMAQRRSELWKQRQQNGQPGQIEDDVCDGEKSDCGDESENILDNEDEEELTDTEDSLDDEEEEEVEIRDSARVKSAFLDDEAMESDAEESDGMETDEPINIPVNEDTNSQQGDCILEETTSFSKKKLKRIIKPFTDDSDDESDTDPQPFPQPDSSSVNESLGAENRPNDDSTDTWDDEDDVVTPHQPRSTGTPNRAMTQSKSDYGLLSPVANLTGLQNLNSGSKFLHESPVSPFIVLPDPSPLQDNNWHSHKKLFSENSAKAGTQKKLFPEVTESQEQEHMDELVGLCSGDFSSESQGVERSLVAKPSTLENDTEISTQVALEICSGDFNNSYESVEEHRRDFPEQNVNAQGNEMAVNEVTPSINLEGSCSLEIKGFSEGNDEDKLISQLLDEEEMENFKRKFDSPVITDTQQNSSRLVLDSSDDEGENEVIKLKKQKKLTFSDDESASEDNNEDEEIDLHDATDEEEFSELENVDKLVDYDSEENEIELEAGERTKTLKASDFFENEAELSESEWGSEDEDEKGLDDLEFEQGDNEVFDENKMRRDLEKMHMRQVLDDDNREVKLLQELLLDDGELHGTGRQRQFRWKNIDSLDDENDENKQEEVETCAYEEETEEEWRRKRFERETFLREKAVKFSRLDNESDFIELTSDSMVLKLGQAALSKSQSQVPNDTPVEKPKVAPSGPVIRQPFSILNKRGSFLTRDEQVLARLAEFTKDASNTVVGGPKNSRNFVFQTVSISADSKTTLIGINKKRKASDGTPNIIKKLRLTGVSPAVEKKKAENPRVKKLFKDI